MEEDAKSELYWTEFVHDRWRLHMAATGNGLCYVGSPNGPLAEMEAWAKRRFPDSSLIRGDERLQAYAAELAAYLQGKCGSLDVPLDCWGTPFQREVWAALREIPYGQTRSYSEIAARLQKPAAVRAVGAAIGANPLLIAVPCHRAIGKNGSLTGYRGGLAMKSSLLRLEGEGRGFSQSGARWFGSE